MVTTQIRCLVVRVPEEAPVRPQAAWREALPWADPYVLGLIRKLQREVREERAAYFATQRDEQQLGNRTDDVRSDHAVAEEILNAEEFTAEEWDESIRTGPRKGK